jgi:hypothetical protein
LKGRFITRMPALNKQFWRMGRDECSKEEWEAARMEMQILTDDCKIQQTWKVNAVHQALSLSRNVEVEAKIAWMTRVRKEIVAISNYFNGQGATRFFSYEQLTEKGMFREFLKTDGGERG